MNVMGKLIFLVILYVLFALEEYFYVIFAVSLCVREWIETVPEDLQSLCGTGYFVGE